MAVDQSFKDLCKWVALTLVVSVLAIVNYAGPGQPDTKFGFYLAIAITIMLVASERFRVWRLSNFKYLEKTAGDLWSVDPLKQCRAMRRLSLVVGARFGGHRGFWTRHHATRCKLWRTWWEQHAGNLIWNPELAAYVEDTSPVDESSERS